LEEDADAEATAAAAAAEAALVKRAAEEAMVRQILAKTEFKNEKPPGPSRTVTELTSASKKAQTEKKVVAKAEAEKEESEVLEESKDDGGKKGEGKEDKSSLSEDEVGTDYDPALFDDEFKTLEKLGMKATFV